MKQGDITIQDQAAVLPANKVGHFIKNFADGTGTTAYTGLGFTPSSIIFLASQPSSKQTSWGFDDGTSRKVLQNRADTDNTYIYGSISIFPAPNGSDEYTGIISSFDTDGFTIQWTNVGGSPSGNCTIAYMAFK